MNLKIVKKQEEFERIQCGISQFIADCSKRFIFENENVRIDAFFIKFLNKMKSKEFNSFQMARDWTIHFIFQFSLKQIAFSSVNQFDYIFVIELRIIYY